MNLIYPKEYCGLFGVYGHRRASELVYMGLYALQHRGQESAGIVSSDGKDMRSHRGMGLVSEVFDQGRLSWLSGHLAIGHVRYSTAGSALLKNAQPLLVEYAKGSLAIAHNGNLVNAVQLRNGLEASGSIFQTTVDSEIVLHLIARSQESSLENAILDSLQQLKGAYSFLFMTEKELLAARDPYGFRPLSIGQLKDAVVLASETCALDIIDAQYIRDIEPGELLIVNEGGIKSVKGWAKKKLAMCIFELIYFSRPDSHVFGRDVHRFRKELGRHLAQEYPANADVVIAVPDSGVPAALGFSQESGIPYDTGLIRNHYIGRTFIMPDQLVRDVKVKIKLNPILEVLDGKRVVVIDDSIVRGTTNRKIAKILRKAGAKEIHTRISCPPHKYPCFYGIDFPTRKELIASTHTVEEIRKYLRLDSLAYLSLKGLLKVAGTQGSELCIACFTGEYPIPFEGQVDKYTIEAKRRWLESEEEIDKSSIPGGRR